MKYYKLTYLISPDVSEEELKNLSQRVSSFIQEEGGILVGNLPSSELMKKRLGYPIKDREVAYLSALNFQLNPEKLANIEKKLKSTESILRYLILVKKPAKMVEVLPPKPLPKTKEPEPSQVLSSKTPEGKPKEKVELKEIEKKLDEILEEKL